MNIMKIIKQFFRLDEDREKLKQLEYEYELLINTVLERRKEITASQAATIENNKYALDRLSELIEASKN